MNVKLQAMLNCGRWVEAEYGRRMLERVLARCSPAVRARYESGIAIEWVPMADLMEFYEAVVAVVGDGDRGVLRASGAASARKNFRGWATRMATWLLSAETVLRRASSLWRQYNDGGELCLLELSDGVCRLEIRGVPAPHWGFCTSLLGWADELAAAVGWKKPHATHPECRAEGGERCIIEIRFRA
jgi:hypothetical protein